MVDRDPVEMLAEEFARRFRAGEQPSIEEYTERYPEYADRVLRTFPALVLMENLAANDQDASDSASRPVDPANEAVSGMVLGDFRIIREVGRGGMGVVYEAEQVSLARHVALKLLPKQVWRDPKQKKRFEREVRAAAQLHHTNIVPVFGAGEQDGFHYYVMQFIEGLSLAQVLDELKRVRDGQAPAVESASELARSFVGNAESTGSTPSASVLLHRTDRPPHSTGVSRPQPDAERRDSDPDNARTAPEIDRVAKTDDTATTRLSDTSAYSIRSVLNARRNATSGAARDYWQSIARIGIQVADALEHAHSQGICHRDIKPANLLLDTRGTVWITDFGLAKADEYEDVTNTGDIIGTLRYIAPEAFDGLADYRSDLYGLGLTLYELVALRAAFDETERNRLMRQVMEAHPTRLKTLNPAIPRDLETIIAKTMERDPLRRYPSASELAADLRRFLRDEPIQARRIGRFERVWRWCRRNPGISWTTAIASLLLIATVATAFLLVTGQRDKALQLARDKQQQAERLAVLAEEKARLAEQEQHAKDAAQAALTREEVLRKREAELRQVAETARDRADQAAKESQTVTNFLLLEMYGAASTGRTHGEELTVRSLLDWSAERADRLFTEQPLQEAAVRDAIGQAYQRLGLFDKARQQLEQALDIRQRILGHDHAATLATTNALALVLYHQGKYTEPHDLCLEALPILRQTVGTEHPTTLSMMNTLAMSLHGLRRYAEAQTLCEEALEIQRRTLGLEHPETLATMNTLAMARHSQKDYVGARKILNESLEILQRHYGPDHANTLSAMANLAASIYGEGDYEAAQQAYAECWEAMKRVIGPEHPTTLAIQENLAVTMMYQKKYTEAEPLLRQALDLRKQSNGPSDWRTTNAASQLAACLTQQGQYDESERLLLDSYDRLISNTDTPPEFVRLTLRRLLILYRDWKRPDDMKIWRAKLVQFNASAPH